jgi:hypothetical protein
MNRPVLLDAGRCPPLSLGDPRERVASGPVLRVEEREQVLGLEDRRRRSRRTIGSSTSAVAQDGSPARRRGARGPARRSVSTCPGACSNALPRARVERLDNAELLQVDAQVHPLAVASFEVVIEAFAFMTGFIAWMLDGLDAAQRQVAHDRLHDVMRAHDTGLGVVFDSRGWIVGARCA